MTTSDEAEAVADWGQGLGPTFLAAGLDFAHERDDPARSRLAVAGFNERAIALYERSGFMRTRTYVHETNGGAAPFVELERSA